MSQKNAHLVLWNVSNSNAMADSVSPFASVDSIFRVPILYQRGVYSLLVFFHTICDSKRTFIGKRGEKADRCNSISAD